MSQFILAILILSVVFSVLFTVVVLVLRKFGFFPEWDRDGEDGKR